MNGNKKNIVYFVLLEVVTAVFFLIIGSLLPFIFGIAHTQDTVVEYVPVQYTVTSTTTNSATSSKSTTVSEHKTTASSETTKKNETQTIKKINLNTATMDDLMTIKGIGEAYARRIIEFRDAIGGFTYMEQLKEIEGIGEGRYNAWTPYFTLED